MENKIWVLYIITNLINKKVYIGQTTNISKRWSDHRVAATLNKPTQAVHYALIKYGLDNFEFKIIASCKAQDDANFIETELVSQYDSFIKNGKGYNVTLGGRSAPKTEEWKEHMSKIMKPIMLNRLALEMPEQKHNRYQKISSSLKGRDRVPGSGRKKGSTGQINANRKFSKIQVELIINQHNQGISIHKLAIIHNTNRKSISRIIRGITYKNF